ncbi:hypothetical protein F7725_020286, partial [Dissostichus mawsoni]
MEFAKKRKVDQENRQFKTDRTEKYCFFLPDHANAKLTCLICMQNHSVSTMSKTTSAKESATAASLHVSWTLARAKKPFADAELIKRCAIDMAREVLNPDEKQQKKVVELLKQKDLLLHNDVHWLSKGRVLERVCDLRDELVSFLSSLQSQKAHEFFSFLTDTKIMSHLNHLNLQLQGKNHTVAEMYEAVEAFRSKLHLLERDIHGRKLHFPRLREHCEKNEMPEDPVMKDFVSKLAENFKERFESSPKISGDILLFLRQPFSVSADGQWTGEAKRLVPSIEEGALQMEVLEMGSSELLKAQHKDAP